MFVFNRSSMVIGAWLAVLLTAANACQVPVFRYALERWTADPFEVLITAENEEALTDQDREVVRFLHSVKEDPSVMANLMVRFSGNPAPNNTVEMQLFYPKKIADREASPVWTGALTIQNAYRDLPFASRRSPFPT